MNLRRIAAAVIGLFLWTAGPSAYSVEFGAFGDIRFIDSNATAVEESFALGQFDLYAMQKINDSTSVFVEYVLETGSSNEIVVDLERLYISRRFNDAFTLGAGRYHAPLGYWNRNFHHGVLMQDSVSRPSFLEFEDGASATLPMHVIGMMATGTVDLGHSDLGYELFFGNASSLDTSAVVPREIDVNNVSAPGENFLVGARGLVEFPDQNISVGIFAMSNPVFDSCSACGTAAQQLVGQVVTGVDFRYVPGRFDILAEYYNYDNTDELGTGFDGTATAYYAQFGYRITDVVKVIYRHEDLTIDNPADAYFTLLGTTAGTHEVAVARFDLDESNAMFVEYKKFNPDGGTKDVNTWTLSWAFLMF
ncbi:MAG: hypothetical protein FD165_1227 [Gammaproteobacteria bacterium]|nr:MAG: hypothetical protein FD165_1227 [Gammaproteobacteria bacterium]TND07386.1 MAG: hypothetical protein FD120_124 [Gammaproteobacteria bacterium]